MAYIEQHKVFLGGIVCCLLGIGMILSGIFNWRHGIDKDSRPDNFSFIGYALYQKFGYRYLRIRNVFLGVLLVALGVLLVWSQGK